VARDIVFVPDDAGIRAIYTGESSDVVRFIRKRAGRVERMAKLLVGKGTGRLASSIKTFPTQYSPLGYPYVRVGSMVSYALIHHEGTRPHIIAPNTPGGMLRFPSRGRAVYATVVMHPGTRPNPYLTTPLRIVMTNRSE
jgi:hypothetical protein